MYATFFVLSLCASCVTYAQDVMLTRVLKDSLFIPWEIIYGPDDHIWFTQKNGYVCRMDTAGAHTDTLLHEPATITLKESGMLGMALHPTFETYPYVYIVWEYLRQADSAIFEQVCRYEYEAGSKKLVNKHILLDSIRGFKFHNGCRLLIEDDKLFISVADAADSTEPQDLTSINGKILRLGLDGSIPADNPIMNSAIWSWGHRNVQGMVMVNGILYASEHGPNTDDEVNIITAGGNYGWPFVRGYCDKTYEQAFCSSHELRAPLKAWTPTIAPCGIDHYHHAMFPSLRGTLLMTTLKDSHLYKLELSDEGTQIMTASVLSGITYGRLRDICISPEGKIYLSTTNSNADGKPPFTDRIVEVTNPAWGAHEPGTLLVYPNPAKDELWLYLSTGYTTSDLAIYDIFGRVVMRGNITPAAPSINIADLPAGLYHIKLGPGNGTHTWGRFMHTR